LCAHAQCAPLFFVSFGHGRTGWKVYAPFPPFFFLARPAPLLRSSSGQARPPMPARPSSFLLPAWPRGPLTFPCVRRGTARANFLFFLFFLPRIERDRTNSPPRDLRRSQGACWPFLFFFFLPPLIPPSVMVMDRSPSCSPFLRGGSSRPE